MLLRRSLAGAVVALVLAGYASEAPAQTADDLFNDQVLQRIDIYVNSRDLYWLKANYALNTYYPADFKWRGQTVRNVGIRSRGTGSRSQTKIGLRVDFNRYVTGQTFLGLKALVLDNLVQDSSNIREVVAMKVFRRLGLPAPREAFAALYVNNSFAGLYAVVEDVDTTAAARLFGESEGFLFEYHWTMFYNFQYLGPALSDYAPMFQPVNHEFDPQAALYGPIEAMIRTINEAPDEEFAAAVSAYLDLPICMRHVAVQAFLAERDGLLGNWGLNNFYFYRFQGRNLSQFIAWDADNALFAVEYSVVTGHNESVLMRRAMRVPDLRDVYFAALLETAALADQVDDAGPGWLEREVVRLQDLIRTTVYADPAKPYTNEEFDLASATLADFARRRGAFVRCETARLTRPGDVSSACDPRRGVAATAR